MKRLRVCANPVAAGFLFTFFACGTAAIFGQASTGTISGVVKDTTGAVLPGATVAVRNVDTGQTRNLISDDQGRYRALELAVGSYEIRAELVGFQTAVRTGITLTVGRDAVVDLTLAVGEISEQVVVSGEAPMVNTTSATLSELISEQQLHDLPLNSRNLAQLSLLSPGVNQAHTASYTGSSTGPAAVKISMSGAKIYMTGFLLDGVDITDSSRASGVGGAAGSLFGVETVREFQVITNNFSAQFSRFAGGLVTMVTKSGTNEFHGSVFEFHRNDNLDARNFFDTAKKPEFKRNQFGATFGGPIRKDHTFFFTSYEGFREVVGLSLFALVPTAAARQGVLPGRVVQVNPAIRPFLDLYPLPNGRELAGGTGEYFASKPLPVNEDFFTGRVDHSFSDYDSIFARYSVTDGDRTLGVNALKGAGWFSESFATYVTIEEKHIFSPTLLNTARFGFQRTRWSQKPPNDDLCGGDCDGQPINIGLIADQPFGDWQPGGGISGLGNAFVGQNVTNAFSYTDDLFLSRGRHDLKAGLAISRFQNNDFFNGWYGGRYRFQTIDRLLTGQPVDWFGGVPGSSSLRGFRETVFGFYFQDDMKITPRFTLNLGLRYEFISEPKEVNGKMVNLRNPLADSEAILGAPFFKNPSKRNFAPRIGLAWDPFGDGKTSIRSGFGIFHDTILFYHYGNQARRNAPLNTTMLVVNPTFPRPALTGTVGRTMFPAEFEPHQPYVMQWNLAIQREVLAGATVSLAYVGSRGVHLLANRNINVAAPSQIINGQKFFGPGLPRRNPSFADISLYDFAYNSSYHGLQFSARKRLSGGLQLQASYTWGGSLDAMSRVNQGDFSNGGGPPQDPYDVKGSNWGRSDHHIGHVFTFNYAYELPLRQLSGPAKVFLQGWQLNGILNLSTGNPMQITLGSPASDWNRDLATGEERPSLKAGRSNNPVRADGRDPNLYFDPSAFDLQPRGFYGNVGRNTLIAPGIAQFDFSLMKNTALSEDNNLQFRAEFFNVFNRPNFGSPSTGVFANPDGGFLPAVGRIIETRTTSRQIQLGLRLVF